MSAYRNCVYEALGPGHLHISSFIHDLVSYLIAAGGNDQVCLHLSHHLLNCCSNSGSRGILSFQEQVCVVLNASMFKQGIDPASQTVLSAFEASALLSQYSSTYFSAMYSLTLASSASV